MDVITITLEGPVSEDFKSALDTESGLENDSLGEAFRAELAERITDLFERREWPAKYFRGHYKVTWTRDDGHEVVYHDASPPVPEADAEL